MHVTREYKSNLLWWQIIYIFVLLNISQEVNININISNFNFFFNLVNIKKCQILIFFHLVILMKIYMSLVLVHLI